MQLILKYDFNFEGAKKIAESENTRYFNSRIKFDGAFFTHSVHSIHHQSQHFSTIRKIRSYSVT